ncbi:MAG: hypothetical protein GF388_04250 [Candidatus Aegiribacteria sp.]|nr:hypothetical protein [Candidatus Aegiribacteria sp.]MBD3294450.1 hypothetical protein [Candidatus Fermentibacteria bacterium]
MVFLLLAAVLTSPSTPEEFLSELCDSSRGQEGLEYWISTASEDAVFPYGEPDSMRSILNNMEDLTVEPGDRTSFMDMGNIFVIEFGDSRWTWIDPRGNVNRKLGLATVRCENGSYSWTVLPVLDTKSFSLGMKERLIAGLMVTVLVLVFGAILVAWASRRYSSPEST